MKALSQNTTIKLAIEHNISSLKVIQARYDLSQTILSVKENIEARYGSQVSFLRLQLRNIKNELVADLNDDMRPLGFYGAQTGMILYVQDLNPNSIHKQIEDYEGVDKYVMSEQDYQKLPQNFRKWKQQQMLNNPQLLKQTQVVLQSQTLDPQYMNELAATIQIKSRCKLESGARGQICYVGKIPDLGPGFFVGVRLDEPFGTSSGTVKGVKYFQADNKYAVFARPNTLQIGDFPVLDLDDEL